MRRIAIAVLLAAGVIAASVPAQASNRWSNRNTQSCYQTESDQANGGSAYAWCWY